MKKFLLLYASIMAAAFFPYTASAEQNEANRSGTCDVHSGIVQHCLYRPTMLSIDDIDNKKYFTLRMTTNVSDQRNDWLFRKFRGSRTKVIMLQTYLGDTIGTVERIAAVSKKDPNGRFISSVNNVKAFPPVIISKNSEQEITLTVKEVKNSETVSFITDVQDITNTVPVVSLGTKAIIDTGSTILSSALNMFTDNIDTERELTFTLQPEQIANLDGLIFYPAESRRDDFSVSLTGDNRISVNGVSDYITLKIEVVDNIFSSSRDPFLNSSSLRPFFVPFFDELRNLKGKPDQFFQRCSAIKNWATTQFNLVDDDVAMLAIHFAGMHGAWYDPNANNQHERYNCFSNEDLRKFPYPGGFIAEPVDSDNNCRTDECKAAIEFIELWKRGNTNLMLSKEIAPNGLELINLSSNQSLTDYTDVPITDLRSRFRLRRWGKYSFNSSGMTVNTCMDLGDNRNVPLTLEFGVSEKAGSVADGESVYSIDRIDLLDRINEDGPNC